MKYVLALSRMGSIAATARALGVNETTVSRRIQSLENHFQQKLFVRSSAGTQILSDVGNVLVEHAVKFENEAAAVIETLDSEQQNLSGTVRITSVPVIINRVLVPALDKFITGNSKITVELIPDDRNLNLTQREADIAIRLARPIHGGFELNVRRVGRLNYGIFCSKDIDQADHADLAWIGYDEASAYLPQAKWLSKVLNTNHSAQQVVKVSDTDTAIETAACGLGKAILPVSIAVEDKRLQQVFDENTPDLPKRDVWLLSHAKQSNLKIMQAAMDWIRDLDW